MSLVTLEGIKAAVPTLLPKIGLFLGRAVTVITANPTNVAAVIIGIASIALFIFLVKAIIRNNALIKRVEESIQKGKDFINESEARSIETQEFILEQTVYSECISAEIDVMRRMLVRRNQNGAEIDRKFPEFPI